MATFSVTELGTYRRCRRQWNWSSKNRENLTTIGSGPEQLELGSLVHRTLADWMVEDDPTQIDLGDLFLYVAASRQKELSEAYEEQFGTSIPMTHLETLHDMVPLGVAMMRNYQAYHKTPLPSHMKFAMPEQEILVPVPGTEHLCDVCFPGMTLKDKDFTQFFHDPTYYSNINRSCKKCDGFGFLYHYLSGTLDGLIRDDHRRLFVLEHKTYENRPQLIDLSMNDQFFGYCWLVSQLDIGTVHGVAYDGMWKREKPPKYLQKEKRAGTLEDLFIRKTLPKSKESIEEWGKNLTPLINEMASNPPLYPNVPWQGCSGCYFIEPCRMLMLGEDPTNLIALRYTERKEIIRGGSK